MFNQRKHKRFSYKPRLKDSDELKSKDDFGAKWNEVNGNTKRQGSIMTTLPALIIMLVSLFVVIYILEGYIN